MVDRTLLGRRNDGSYGLDISLPGFDVKTALPHQMAFSTQWASAAVIHQTGIVVECRGKTVAFPALPFVPMTYMLIRSTDGTLGNTMLYPQLDNNMIGTRIALLPWCRVRNDELFFDDALDGFFQPLINYDVRYFVFNTPGRD